LPYLHSARSLRAARVLTEAGPVEGAVGWTYALALGFALVYLGEHYVVDLIAGAALVELVRRATPRAAPAGRARRCHLSRPRPAAARARPGGARTGAGGALMSRAPVGDPNPTTEDEPED